MNLPGTPRSYISKQIAGHVVAHGPFRAAGLEAGNVVGDIGRQGEPIAIMLAEGGSLTLSGHRHLRIALYGGLNSDMAKRLFRDPDVLGLMYGLLGVLAFSLTLPATRLAVTHFGPALVSLGRAMVAAALAAAYLGLRRQPFPRKDFKAILIVASGVILGFPFLTAWAMSRVDASHGAVILGLLPLATAGAGALRVGERPSRGFWIASAVGSLVVVAFAMTAGAGSLQGADLALVAAVALAALGYAEGGRLARHLGGLEVISWALIICVPVLIWPALQAALQGDLSAPLSAWLAFGYICLISQFLGFAAWYRGLALGGVARVGQVQLMQPFFTILGSALILGEPLGVGTLGAAGLVLVTVALGRKASVRRV